MCRLDMDKENLMPHTANLKHGEHLLMWCMVLQTGPWCRIPHVYVHLDVPLCYI